eukprot:12923545-Prorocentrum_lima.AAC.1
MPPTLGALRGMGGIQIVRAQSDNGGEFINEPLISGCRSRGIHMSHINGLIERMVGIVKEHMRKVLHGSKLGEQFWPYAAMYVADVMRHRATH